MLNCKEATRLMSQEQDRHLTLRERLALRYHTALCIGCTNYRKHMRFLRKAAERFRKGLFDGE
jgi:hypothetical protein